MGLVHTPDGSYVPEALANSNSMPVLSNNRSLSVQNGDEPENTQGRVSLSQRLRSSISSTRQPQQSTSPQGSKRKRSMDMDDESDGASRSEGSPTGLKKQKKAWDPTEANRILDDLKETIKALDEGAQWYHEQNERMLKESSIYDE